MLFYSVQGKSSADDCKKVRVSGGWYLDGDYEVNNRNGMAILNGYTRIS